MTFELDISSFDLAEQINAKFDEVRVPIQAAMAGRFAELCRENVGSELGANRPETWPPLFPKYARRVGRTEATLFLTGQLFNSIQVDPYNPDAAVVFSDCEYAATHQNGDASKNIPARPFFPIIGVGTEASLTPYTLDQVIRAAQNEAERLLT